MKPQVKIRKREERRLQQGHLWVFSNEITSIEGDPAPGDAVRVVRHDGKVIGTGLFNPHSLIAVRMFSREDDEIGPPLFRERIATALTRRRAIYPDDDAFRLIHGESDGLPGLLIDVYGDTIVLQVLSVGIERRIPIIVDVLRDLLGPRTIVARNDTPVRQLEGLDQESRILLGDPAPVVIREHGIIYDIDVLAGQKTGMFLDQKDNRFAVRRYLRGRSVLDCFCNVGGFALNAAAAGASSVAAVDSSASAAEATRRHSERNSLPLKHVSVEDAFDHLKALRNSPERLGGIILDPPAFTKNRRSVTAALKAYRTLNILALSLVERGGILVSASCSHHISRDEFLNMIRESAGRVGRNVTILEHRGAAADHPVHPAMPETEYLKLVICAVE